MSFMSYREESKKNYGRSDQTSANPEQLKLGAILRIADSLEKMEEPYLKLLSDVEYLRGLARDRYADIEHLRKSNAALRGVITKLKKTKQ